MQLSVLPPHVWKNKPVVLKKQLPINHGFGNSKPVAAGARGRVISNGFEAGMLRVIFDLYAGKETVKFNELSAKEFLTSDIALQKPVR